MTTRHPVRQEETPRQATGVGWRCFVALGDSFTAGTGDPGGQAHAHNENIRIDLYSKAAKQIARILKEFGE